MTAAMAADRPHRNVYDPRVRELVRATGNPDLFPELDVPHSTSAGGLRGEFKPAHGTDLVCRTEVELLAENAKLKRRNLVLATVVRLLLVLVRTDFGLPVDRRSTPGWEGQGGSAQSDHGSPQDAAAEVRRTNLGSVFVAIPRLATSRHNVRAR
jgi:hypothetical protein